VFKNLEIWLPLTLKEKPKEKIAHLMFEVDDKPP